MLRIPAMTAKIVGYWRSTGLLRAWEKQYQAEAVRREEELFPNLSRDRRGLDDGVPAVTTPEEEMATDVGAPIDQPADLEVRGGADGRTLLRANQEENLESDETQRGV